MASKKKTVESKKSSRSWAQILVLVVPLAIVGLSAMAISYMTLIDVARVNGLPLPELFPILVDVGTVTCMIVAAQVRQTGRGSAWLAYVTFAALSSVSVLANMSHAQRAADLSQTTLLAAMVLAATPPAALLAITHLVMTLVPDERERRQLAARQATVVVAPVAVETPSVASVRRVTERAVSRPVMAPDAESDRVARDRVLEYFATNGVKPTGAIVGEWLGVSARTAQRRLESWFPNDEGLFQSGLRAIGD